MNGKLKEAYIHLILAIDSGDGASELVYSLTEKATVSPLLQECITQDDTVEVRAMDCAYQLLSYHYASFVRAGITPPKTRTAYLKTYVQGIEARLGQPGKEKQDELARFLLDSMQKDIVANPCCLLASFCLAC